MESGKWTLVPGTRDVQLFPLIRKPSILCSNGFLLAAPKQVIVLDPGADIRQVEEIRRLLSPLLEDSPRPVFVYLTHCHIDHFFALPSLLEEPFRARLICHARGTRALDSRDRVLTVSDLHALDVPACPVWASLFEAESPATDAAPRFHPFEEFFRSERMDLAEGPSVSAYQVTLGDHDRMEIFHTPGHSPDSISFRVGGCLFVGDLPFATDIGVAGAVGWDPKALGGSLRLLDSLGRDVDWVLPGHGKPFPARELEKVALRQQKDLEKLSDLAPLDRERLLDLLDYANVVLDEISSIFAVVSARLLKTVHWLEVLDEEEEAARLLKAVDLEAAESLIDDFHYFVESFRGAELKNVILVRALHFMARFDKTFSPQTVSYLLNPFLLRRVRTLFSEFYHAVYGFRFALPEARFELHEAVEEVLNEAREPLQSDQAVLDATAAEAPFLEALASRIADHPIFEGVRLSLAPRSGDTAPVPMDRTVFQDLLRTLLERLAVRGFDRIEMVPGQEGRAPFLRVSAASSTLPSPPEARSLQILQRTMRNHGGDFRTLQAGPPALFVFEFPEAGGP